MCKNVPLPLPQVTQDTSGLHKSLGLPLPARDWHITSSCDICHSSKVASQHRPFEQCSTTGPSAQKEPTWIHKCTQNNSSLSLSVKRHILPSLLLLTAGRQPTTSGKPGPGPRHPSNVDVKPPQVKAATGPSPKSKCKPSKHVLVNNYFTAQISYVKDPSQPLPFSLPLKLWKLYGEAKIYIAVSCITVLEHWLISFNSYTEISFI